MSGREPGRIDVGGLRSRANDRAPETAARIDGAGESPGFVEREPRGRPRFFRTGHVHARVGRGGVGCSGASPSRRRGNSRGGAGGSDGACGG